MIMMINRIYSRMHAERMTSNLRTSIISIPVFSRRFPMECVLQPIDPVRIQLNKVAIGGGENWSVVCNSR